MIYFSAPVWDDDEQVTAVAVLRVLAEEIWEQVEMDKDHAGPGSVAILFDEYGIRLAHASDRGLIFKSVVPLDPLVEAQLLAERRLGDKEIIGSTNFPELAEGLTNAESQPYFTHRLVIRDEIFHAGAARLSSKSWTVIETIPESSFMAPISQLLSTNGLLVGAAGLLTLLVTALSSRQIVKPVRELTTAAQRLAGGDLEHPLRSSRFQAEDELGVLLQSFETMRQELAGSLSELERRVKELTVLHAVAVAGTETNCEDELIERSTQIIGEILYSDHFGVLLADDQQKALRFHSSNRGLVKKDLSSLIPHGSGVVGRVFANGQALRLFDVTQETNYIEISPSIRSELCVPLKVDQKIIGVINAENSQVDAFAEADEHLLSTFAGQLATAIEKVRLHINAQERLEHISALHAIDVAISGSVDLEITLDILLEQVITQLNVDAVTVLLYSPDTQTLEFHSQRGFSTIALRHTRLSLGESHAGKVALDNKIIQISDLTTDQNGFLRSPLIREEKFISYLGVPLTAKDQIQGVLEIFHRSPLNPDSEWMELLKALSTQAAIAIDNATLFHDLQRSNEELIKAYDSTLEGWALALALRDEETEDHTRRTTQMTVQMANAIGMSEDEINHVRRGALLHDIGKMGIPDSILHKSGKLTEDEWEIIRQHPVYAYNFLSQTDYLRPALDIPYCHHEKWDGTGYPRGLNREQIPLAARIFAVIDVWDALNSDRPYRKAWDKDRVIAYIQEQSGTHFDPDVVEVFLALLDSECDEEKGDIF